jgi:hypothetical protein
MGSSSGRQKLERRVVAVAEQVLAKQRYVTAVDMLVGLGWLAPSSLDRWRQGRVESLESVVGAGLGKVSAAMRILHRWAQEHDLKPSETVYVARSRERQVLRFSVSGDPAVETAYRTHWISPELSERKRQRLAEQTAKPPDLVVIQPLNPWSCTSCEGTGDLLIMEEPGPVCLTCADLEHLVFLPAGNAALTRRSRKASTLSAVVVRFSRARKRYERRGVLVEEDALADAEQRCLDDADARARRRERETERRAATDDGLIQRLAAAIRVAYPGCPADRAAQMRGTRPSVAAAVSDARSRARPGGDRPRRRRGGPTSRYAVRRAAHDGDRSAHRSRHRSQRRRGDPRRVALTRRSSLMIDRGPPK